jgi:hypothetical protein
MLTFKILRFQKSINLAGIYKNSFLRFQIVIFFKMQLPNNSFFTIWFKITLFVYKIALKQNNVILFFILFLVDLFVFFSIIYILL